jgi:hypothetical protein
MDAEITQTIERFSGINNVDPVTRISPTVADHRYVYQLQQANNMEIDNTFSIKSRSGYASVKTGTDIHSMWSNGKVWFYVDGSILYQMDEIYGTKTIRSDLTKGAQMSYAPWNDRYYYTNGYQKGYVKNGVDYAFTDPAQNFKKPLPAGQLIEYFNACLYVAVGKILYIGDPLCDYYDTRKGYKQFSNYINMVRAVDDGLFVSDDRVWFVKGKGADEFTRDEVYPSKAIMHTDVRVNAKYIDDQMSGNVAMWTGENGICLGDNSGNVMNLTEARYTFTARGRGTGFIRENGNVRHYINALY